MTTHEIDMLMPAEAHAATEARHALDPLETRIDPTVLEDLRLLVTELVTNSVRHSGADQPASVGLRVRVDGPVVAVEVSDEGTGFEHEQRATDPEAKLTPGGWGLYMVERLACRWGVMRDDRHRVWFELKA